MTDITRTLTFDDLIAQYDHELTDLRERYEETTAHAREEYGDDPEEWPEDVRQEVQLLNQSKATIDQRVHALETLREEYDGDTFEVKMLTGNELADIETELRAEAQQRDLDTDHLETLRQRLAVDKATVDAPTGVPTSEDGPVPSMCPNPLTMALFESVQRLNNAGTTDFRASGFDDPLGTAGPSELSDSPTSSRPE